MTRLTVLAALDGMPVSTVVLLAVVLAVLLWGATRIVVALIEGRNARRAGRVDEILHHVDAVGVAVGDAGAQVLDELRRLREAVERLGGTR
jgi:hypothetical protein